MEHSLPVASLLATSTSASPQDILAYHTRLGLEPRHRTPLDIERLFLDACCGLIVAADGRPCTPKTPISFRDPGPGRLQRVDYGISRQPQLSYLVTPYKHIVGLWGREHLLA